jgi:hypothetical protein
MLTIMAIFSDMILQKKQKPRFRIAAAVKTLPDWNPILVHWQGRRRYPLRAGSKIKSDG